MLTRGICIVLKPASYIQYPRGQRRRRKKKECDGNVLYDRVLPARAVAFCVDRLMRAEEVCTALYGRDNGAGLPGAGLSVGVGQGLRIGVEGGENWDQLDVLIESGTGVCSS